MPITIDHSPAGLIAALAQSSGAGMFRQRQEAQANAAFPTNTVHRIGPRGGAAAQRELEKLRKEEIARNAKSGVTTYSGADNRRAAPQSDRNTNPRFIPPVQDYTDEEQRTGKETEAGRAIRASDHMSPEEKTIAAQQVSRKERVDPDAGKSQADLKVEFDRGIENAIYRDDNGVPWVMGKDGVPTPQKVPEQSTTQFKPADLMKKRREMLKELQDAAEAEFKQTNEFDMGADFNPNSVPLPTAQEVRARMEEEAAFIEEANFVTPNPNDIKQFDKGIEDLAGQLGIDIEALRGTATTPSGIEFLGDQPIVEATPDLEPLNINGVETSAADVEDFFSPLPGSILDQRTPAGESFVAPQEGAAPAPAPKKKGKAAPAPLASPAAIADIERMSEGEQNKLEAKLRTAKSDDERRKIITRTRLEQFKASLPDDDPLKKELSPLIEGAKSILKNFGKKIETPQHIKDIADRRRGRKAKEATEFDTGRTRAERVAKPADLPDLWSAVYQTSLDPKKEARARKALKNFDGNVPTGAKVAIDTAVEIFGGDKGMTPDVLRKTLTDTSVIESNFTTRVQGGGGPARGYAQVEPATAKSLAVNSSALFGKKMESFFPGVIDRMKKATNAEISKMLEKDERLAMTMAAATYMADNAVRDALTGIGK